MTTGDDSAAAGLVEGGDVAEPRTYRGWVAAIVVIGLLLIVFVGANLLIEVPDPAQPSRPQPTVIRVTPTP